MNILSKQFIKILYSPFLPCGIRMCEVHLCFKSFGDEFLRVVIKALKFVKFDSSFFYEGEIII